MGLTLAQKIIQSHLVSGEMKAGSEIALRMDQTLTQDATGTMAYLEFEAIGIPRVRTELSVAYVDHNTLQSGFENADAGNRRFNIGVDFGNLLTTFLKRRIHPFSHFKGKEKDQGNKAEYNQCQRYTNLHK